MLTMKVSKAAMKLVQAGKAFLSSGGVRMMDGTMFEMARPTVAPKLLNTVSNFVSGPVGSGLSIASSLASNVQCAMIQKGVDAANLKLDDVIVRLGRIETAMQGIQTIQVLSWANTALSLANTGISIAGFYMTLTKLKGIEEQLQAFFERYQQDRHGDTVEQFRTILMDLRSDISYLNQKSSNDTFDEDSFVQREPFVEEHLNRAASFIRRVIKEFLEERIDGRVGCQIIFVLATVYAQTANEYCCQYYYRHHVLHALFRDWASVLDEINTSAFRERMRQYFTFSPEYADVSPVKKSDAIRIAMESVSEYQNRLSACEELIRLMPESKFIQLDDMLNQEIYAALARKNPALTDQYITEQIMRADADTSSDFIEIEIPQ